MKDFEEGEKMMVAPKAGEMWRSNSVESNWSGEKADGELVFLLCHPYVRK